MTNDDAFMAIAGVRYCLGRHSYAPSLCCGWLKSKWPTFRDGDRAVILRDISEHIAGVEEGRWHTVQADWEIDLRTWIAFRDWAHLSAESRSQCRAAVHDGGGRP